LFYENKNNKAMITLFKDPFFHGFDSVFDSKLLKTPETKVVKDETGYVISISVPGLTKEDLKISTKEGILKISFEKAEDDDSRNFVSSFTKSYNIPDDVQEKNIEGKVENGVLTISLPIDKRKSIERLISLN
jgi:HSP20 family protein